MAILVGKRKLEVTCRLCDYIYLLDSNEYINVCRDEVPYPEIEFKCPECGKYVYIPITEAKDVKYYFRNKKKGDQLDPLYYN